MPQFLARVTVSHGTTLLKRLFALIFVVALPITGGCVTTKTLTEANARILIQEFMRAHKQNPLVQIGALPQLMKRTLVDYTLYPATGNQWNNILKRLLDHKFVIQHLDVISYPKISGTFAFSPKPGVSANGTTVGIIEYRLESVPASNKLIGTRNETWTWTNTHAVASTNTEKVEGTFGADNKISLVWGLGYSPEYTYIEENGKAIIRSSVPCCYQCPICVTDYVGKPTGQKIETRWYWYEFNPEFQKQFILGVDQQPYVPVGTYQIGAVSDLRLTTGTSAEAKFKWNSTLNDAGRVLYGNDAKLAGEGGATFVKKPDGTWFVDRVWF